MNAREARNVVLLSLLTTVLFSDVLFLGSGFFHRDLFVYHYPMKKVVRESIEHAEFPYWNRYWSGGQPMAANPAYEVFYPPQWLIFAGPYRFGFNLHILFHVYLAVIGMYLLLRAWALREAAAIFGAISFGLGGFFLGTMTTLPTFFVWAWAPLAGWAVVRFLEHSSASRFAVAAAILSMQLLVFEPMALLQVWVLLAAFLVAKKRARGLAAGAGLFAAAFLLAAVQIIPAIDHAGDSVRSRGFAFDVVVDYSMPLIRPLELFIPRMFGVLDPRQQAVWGGAYFSRGTPYLLSISCGLAATILALGGLLARVRGSAAVIWGGIISYVLAIGNATPLYRWSYQAGLRSLRYPEKFFSVFIFVLVVFSALVLDRFLAGDAAVRRWVRITAYFALALSAVPLLFWHVPEAQRVWLGGTLIAAAWAVLASLPPGRPWSFVALFILLVDTVWLGREASPALPRQFFTPPPIVDALDRGHDSYTVFHRGEWIRDENYQRARELPPWILARDGLLPLTPAAWGVRSALGLDFDETALLPTHQLLDLMMRYGRGGAPDWSAPFVESSNVRYILDYSSTDIALTEVTNRGRYYFPDRAAKVLSVRERPNDATVVVETAAESTLIAVVTRHKYWRAAIDGVAVPIAPANIAYQSVRVPAGRHRVAWHYRNPLIPWSGAVSAMAWIAAAVVTTRRRPPHPLQSES